MIGVTIIIILGSLALAGCVWLQLLVVDELAKTTMNKNTLTERNTNMNTSVINEFHKQYQDVYTKPIPRVICKDGFSMSVQANSIAYCYPRKDNAPFYFEFEICFPSEREELIMPFAEEPDYPTDTVYGYVDYKIVDEVIEKHGGLVYHVSEH